MRTSLLAVTFFALAATPIGADDRVDLGVVGRIKTEAFENSQVMDTLFYLTDVYGPRLTGSPEFREAADWAVKRLQSYGLENAHLEKWGKFGRSWSLKRSSVEMIEPRYAALDAAPLAWSESTHGRATGEVAIAQFGDGHRVLDPHKLEAQIDKFIADYKGKLKGKVVLLSAAKDLEPETEAMFSRYSDKDLSELAAAPAPSLKIPFDLKNIKFPEDAKDLQRYYQSLPAPVREQFSNQRRALNVKRARFLKDEGVVAVLQRDERAHDALLFGEAAGSYESKDPLAPPTFVVTEEQYNRMARLVAKNIPVKVRVELEAEASKGDEDGYNVVAELPGASRKEEWIMLGAHFDSWHTATGATDNAAGSAAMIEAVRILSSLHLKLDRSVRIALWSGEEEGLLGSKAYVKEHFGDPDTMKLTEAHAKLSGYFNLDNGSGKIRGVYLQNNDAMRPLFEQWLSPFRDLGVTTISPRNTGGTDHLSFDAIGLPGFQFIQDPLDYSTRTHHSNVDTLDHIQAPDMMQAAAVITSVVYHAANRAEMLPRKELPKVQPKLDEAPGGGPSSVSSSR